MKKGTRTREPARSSKQKKMRRAPAKRETRRKKKQDRSFWKGYSKSTTVPDRIADSVLSPECMRILFFAIQLFVVCFYLFLFLFCSFLVLASASFCLVLGRVPFWLGDGVSLYECRVRFGRGRAICDGRKCALRKWLRAYGVCSGNVGLLEQRGRCE